MEKRRNDNGSFTMGEREWFILYREMFSLSDPAGHILSKNRSIGMLLSWLIDHRYFQEHPGTALKLTEENTPKFILEVTANTTSRDAINAWNRYNQYI